MFPTQETFKEILLRDHLISPEDLERAMEEQDRSGGELSRILLKSKLITEDQLSLVLSEALQLPLINLNFFKIDPSLLKLVPKETAEKCLLIPISKLNDQLTVAMVDPLDILTIDNIKAMTSMSVSVVLARPKEMRAALERSYAASASSDLQEIFQDMKESREAEKLELVREKVPSKRVMEDFSQEAPIVTLTNTIIHQAVAAKASDVFIEPMENCLRIRYRVDGYIREIDRMSKNLHFPLISRVKVISSLDIAEHRLPQDGRFRITTPQNKEVDFRVNVLPTAMGEKIVLRVLDKNQEMADIDKLGFEPEALARLKDCCLRPHGLILACGPTGSGKTTTLYAVLKHIDSPGKNIVTVEDPVEFQIKGFSQVNIRTEFGLSFPAALRSILRQDPDVILIGEVRDSETMDIAVKAALTGHLVVSSLHTTTGPGSITRMLNMGVEPFLITSSVIAIVAQRLVRRVCQNCREMYTVSGEMVKEFRIQELLPNHDGRFWRPRGCDQCLNTGYRGRVAVSETLVLTHKVRELILISASEAEIKAAARAGGMTTMREDAVIKASRGLTTLEEVTRLTAPD
ncbi:MAG: Flp pilus assembly complex ATPase component TadA [Candidatus Omnitrophica bacterium]|nr:Flp pilus assembly complex ATPase component TadA [Candidatus Omnitrophota bacterium]MDE2008589.1 Flp pilus assembly complex ATPase component TadA [Candidatus Omnitrophota bacterium]MDE2214055.1 Flp pilus assembly complex ATPase component TadA [Candidatus Omnitrophota bacterium]MDE2230967.1 Flp pilus assembly complex ATPase component TadA [Candidatus Omnitrophota bacterium]